MSGTCEIGLQSRVVPGVATKDMPSVTGSVIPCAADRDVTAGTVQNFQQRWQAIVGSIQDSQTIVANTGLATGIAAQKSTSASVTASAAQERTDQMDMGSFWGKFDGADLRKSSERRTAAPATAVPHQPPAPTSDGRKMSGGMRVSDSHADKLLSRSKPAEASQTLACSSTPVAIPSTPAPVPTSAPLLDLQARSDDAHHARSLSQGSDLKNNLAVSETGGWTRPASEQTSPPNSLSIQNLAPQIDSEKDATKSSTASLPAVLPLRTRNDPAHEDAGTSAAMGKESFTPHVQQAAITRSPAPANGVDRASPSRLQIPVAAATDASSSIGGNSGASASQIEATKTLHSSVPRDGAASRSHANIESGATASHTLNAPGAISNPGASTEGQFSVSPRAANALLPFSNTFVGDTQKQEAPREPFATIDAAPENAASKWTLASGHQVEAGFQDSSLGWIAVRAQAGIQGIHASIVPSSDVAALSLTSHLAGLNAHVGTYIGHLNPVTIDASDAGRFSHSAGGEMLGSSSENESGQRQHSSAEGSQTETLPNSSRGYEEAPIPSVQLSDLLSGSILQEGHFSVVV